jgi:hypothetical protein
MTIDAAIIALHSCILVDVCSTVGLFELRNEKWRTVKNNLFYPFKSSSHHGKNIFVLFKSKLSKCLIALALVAFQLQRVHVLAAKGNIIVVVLAKN